MQKNNYAIFILSYGRPTNLITYDVLKKQGYSGEIFIICSDDDKTLKEYRERYDNVIVFNKNDYIDKFDIGDNFKDKRVVVYARNAVWDIAEELGYEYFIVLDDDYTALKYIYDENDNYKNKAIKNLDKIFDVFFDYYKKIDALCIAPIQGGDLIGGKKNSMFSGGFMKRKVMNVWFLSTKRKFEIVGRINEDTNTYTHLGTQGKLFLQIPDIKLIQLQTQANEGGLTDFYLDTGTYQKSFYTVMYAPSCVQVYAMNSPHSRLHHRVSWNNTCPKILDESYKKVASA